MACVRLAGTPTVRAAQLWNSIADAGVRLGFDRRGTQGTTTPACAVGASGPVAGAARHRHGAATSIVC